MITLNKLTLRIITISALQLILFLGYYYFSRPNNAFIYIVFSLFVNAFIVATVIWINNCGKSQVKWLEIKLTQLYEITHNLNKSTEIYLNNLPIGIMAINKDKKIVWINNILENILDGSFVGTHIELISRELYQNINDSIEQFEIMFKEEEFLTSYNEEYDVIYFERVTDLKNLENKYLERRLVLGQLILDNFSESLSKLDVEKRAKIQSEYFSEIGKWAEKKQIYLKGFATDKFLLLMDYQKLQELIKEEFEVLDEVRKISVQTKLQITVSIGLVCFDKPVLELQEKLDECVDIAYERGGDQVIVNIQGEQLKYFGGESQAQSKRSRIRSRVFAGQLTGMIESASKVVFLTHKSPDQDGIGGIVGLDSLCKSLGKESMILLDYIKSDESMKRILKLLFEVKNNITAKVDVIEDFIDKDTLIIVVDVNNLNILYGPVKENKTVVIDHHRRSENSIKSDVLYVEPYVSSSTEIVVEILMFHESNLQITPLEATLMLAGIVVDTSNFFLRTGARTYNAASFLRLNGADNVKVKMLLRDSYQRFSELNNLLTTSEVYKNFAIIKSEEHISSVLLAKTCEELLMIDSVDATFVIGKLNDTIVGISARSFGEINVQLLMEEFGGGGHFTSAACQIESTVEEMYEKLKEVLNTLMSEG